jgi:hypothetical protein
MDHHPVPSSGDAPLSPTPRLTVQQMEAVIRRAVELQARETDVGAGEGIAEDELLRIGGEIGLAPIHLRHALAEVRAEVPMATGWADRMFGERLVSASRLVPGESEEVRAELERYFLEREYLAPIRRIGSATWFEKATGLRTGLAMASDLTRSVLMGDTHPHVGAGFQLRKASRVEASVQGVEGAGSVVALVVDLGNERNTSAAGFSVLGVVSSGAVGVAAGIAVAPPLALVGLPILAANLWGARAYYGGVAGRARLHIESILDVLERGEPLVTRRSRNKPFGF